MVRWSVSCGGAYLTIAHALLYRVLFLVESQYKSRVFPYGTRWCVLAQNTWHPRMCIRMYKQNSPSSHLDFFFGGSCEDIVRLSTWTRNSSTVVYFTLADLLETEKVQEAKFRDCHWCISIHFVSVYFDEKWADILKLLVVFGREKSFTQFQIAQKNNNT